MPPEGLKIVIYDEGSSSPTAMSSSSDPTARPSRTPANLQPPLQSQTQSEAPTASPTKGPTPVPSSSRPTARPTPRLRQTEAPIPPPGKTSVAASPTPRPKRTEPPIPPPSRTPVAAAAPSPKPTKRHPPSPKPTRRHPPSMRPTAHPTIRPTGGDASDVPTAAPDVPTAALSLFPSSYGSRPPSGSLRSAVPSGASSSSRRPDVDPPSSVSNLPPSFRPPPPPPSSSSSPTPFGGERGEPTAVATSPSSPTSAAAPTAAPEVRSPTGPSPPGKVIQLTRGPTARLPSHSLSPSPSRSAPPMAYLPSTPSSLSETSSSPTKKSSAASISPSVDAPSVLPTTEEAPAALSSTPPPGPFPSGSTEAPATPLPMPSPTTSPMPSPSSSESATLIPAAGLVTTEVVFLFSVSYTNESEDVVLEHMEDVFSKSLVDLMDENKAIQGWVADDNLSATVLVPAIADDETCPPSDGYTACAVVEIAVELSHSKTLSGGTVRYYFLRYLQDDAQVLNLPIDSEVTYSGDIAEETQVTILLYGLSTLPTDEDIVAFETTLFQVLDGYLSEADPPVKLLLVDVIGVDFAEKSTEGGESRYIFPREGGRALPTSSAPVAFETLITGQYRPQGGKLDYEKLVEDSLDRSGHDFVDELKQQNGGYYEDVTGISRSQSLNSTDAPSFPPSASPTTPSASMRSSTFDDGSLSKEVVTGILVAGASILLLLAAYLLFKMALNSHDEREKGKVDVIVGMRIPNSNAGVFYLPDGQTHILQDGEGTDDSRDGPAAPPARAGFFRARSFVHSSLSPRPKAKAKAKPKPKPEPEPEPQKNEEDVFVDDDVEKQLHIEIAEEKTVSSDVSNSNVPAQKSRNFALRNRLTGVASKISSLAREKSEAFRSNEKGSDERKKVTGVNLLSAFRRERSVAYISAERSDEQKGLSKLLFFGRERSVAYRPAQKGDGRIEGGSHRIDEPDAGADATPDNLEAIDNAGFPVSSSDDMDDEDTPRSIFAQAFQLPSFVFRSWRSSKGSTSSEENNGGQNKASSDDSSVHLQPIDSKGFPVKEPVVYAQLTDHGSTVFNGRRLLSWSPSPSLRSFPWSEKASSPTPSSPPSS